MRFILGHNSFGVDRSGPRTTHYVVEQRDYISPCWVWQLSKTKPNQFGTGGYGKIRVKGVDLLAHRWYYEQANGPIPVGLQVDHLCRHRDCVNPAHLEAVTPLENTRRSRSMKLTYEQSAEIYRRRQKGETIRALAAEFGVSYALVHLIGVNGPDKPRRAHER